MNPEDRDNPHKKNFIWWRRRNDLELTTLILEIKMDEIGMSKKELWP